MTPLPWRSHETTLSDEELLVLDGCYHGWVTPQQLSESTYRLAFNCRHSHGLVDNELRGCVDRLRNRGLLAIESTLHSTTIRATRYGGSQWEAERRPPWDRFCDVLLGGRTGRPDSRIIACSREPLLPSAVLDALSRHGYWRPAPAGAKLRIRTIKTDRLRLAPWRTSEPLTIAAAACVVFTSVRAVNWRAIRAEDWYWTSLNELHLLNRRRFEKT